MLMPHRSYASTANYRFGFNGMENDNEPKGLGNEQDYQSRIYDPRIGRWFSLDPLQKKYPNESNYGFVSNNPLFYTDLDGKEKVITINLIQKDGTKLVFIITDKSYVRYQANYRDLRQVTGFGREFEGGFKASDYETYTIDLSNPKNSSYTHDFKIEEKFNYEFSYYASKWFGSGDQSGKLKPGLVLLGSGYNYEDAQKNEKAAYGSEIISVEMLLSSLEGFKDLTSIQSEGSKMELLEFIKKNEVLKKYITRAFNLTKAAEKLADSNEGELPLGPLRYKGDPYENGVQNEPTTPRLEPGQKKPKPFNLYSNGASPSNRTKYPQSYKVSDDPAKPDTNYYNQRKNQ